MHHADVEGARVALAHIVLDGIAGAQDAHVAARGEGGRKDDEKDLAARARLGDWRLHHIAAAVGGVVETRVR
ncbi:hypothetical protein ON010_g18528 [Phytophthora cinnamomi]|nr:hypothetical protein ON010_g18528 [Phytophthora cinnamomi]